MVTTRYGTGNALFGNPLWIAVNTAPRLLELILSLGSPILPAQSMGRACCSCSMRGLQQCHWHGAGSAAI